MELISAIILLVILGALIILFIASIMIFNLKPIYKKSNDILYSFTKFSIYFVLSIKSIIISCLVFSKTIFFSQLSFISKVYESESMNLLYKINELDSYAPMLLILGILLLCVTIGVSSIIKNNDGQTK